MQLEIYHGIRQGPHLKVVGTVDAAHSCRYTLATRGHSLGIDNDTLFKILGHADFDVISDIYIQADINKLHQKMAKLDPCED